MENATQATSTQAAAPATTTQANPTLAQTAAVQAVAAQAAQAAVPASAQDIASALMTALESRTHRVEAGITKDIAGQYGLTADEVRQILEGEKAKRAAQLPPEQQQQIAKARDMLLFADVKTLGASMGLLDADAAIALMGKDGIKVEDTGAVAGTQAALDALKAARPHLFGAAQAAAAATAQAPAPGITTGVSAMQTTSAPGSVADLIRSQQVKR